MRLESAPISAAAWDRCALFHPAGLYEYSSGYRRLLVELLDCEDVSLAAVDEDGVVRGVLPLLARDGPRGIVLNSQPYHGSYGGILAESVEATDMLHLALIELASTASAVTTVINPLAGWQPLLGWPRDRRIGYFTALAPSDSDRNALLKRLESRARSSVRRAVRSGVSVARDRRQLDWLAGVHHANMEAIGVQPKQPRFFELLAEQPPSSWDVWVASADGHDVAAALICYFGRCATYWTPAVTGAGRSSQALSLLLLEVLVDAASRGFRVFDWGSCRPQQTALRLFKRQWASDVRPYDHCLHVPDRRRFHGLQPDELEAAYPGFYVVPHADLYAGNQSEAPRSATRRS